LQQEERHTESQAPAGQGHVPRHGQEGRRGGREPGARRDGEDGPRLRHALGPQPAPGLPLGEGLRQLRSLQRVQELRHDRAGHGRRDGADRLSGLAPAQARADHRRLGHGHARRTRRDGRPVAAASDWSRPESRMLHAGRRRQPLPHRHAARVRGRRFRAATRQRDREHIALWHLSLQARRPRRLRLHLLPAGATAHVGSLAQDDRADGSDRPRGVVGSQVARRAQGPGQRPRRGLDDDSDEARGHGRPRQGRSAHGRRAGAAGDPERPPPDRARHGHHHRSSGLGPVHHAGEPGAAFEVAHSGAAGAAAGPAQRRSLQRVAFARARGAGASQDRQGDLTTGPFGFRTSGGDPGDIRLTPAGFAGLTALALILAILSYAVQGDVGLNLTDEGLFWYVTERTAAGDVPLRDVRSYEPGRYYWSAAFLHILGPGVKALRVSLAAFQGVGLVLAFLLLRRIVPSVGVLAALGLILVVWMWPMYRSFEHVAVLALLFAAVRVVERPIPSRWRAAGGVVGLAAFVRIDHGVDGTLALLLLLIFSALRRDGVRHGRALADWTLGAIAGYSPMLLLAMLAPGFVHGFTA